MTGVSSVRTESRQTSGRCESDVSGSIDMHSAHKSVEGPLLNELKKDIWNKKNKNEILTVSSRKPHKKPQSNRKQSTPVGGLEMVSGMYSWKKNRKQSENIIFSSMDGWKTRVALAQNLDRADLDFVSKSSVFSSNLGVKSGVKPVERHMHKFEHSSTRHTDNMRKRPCPRTTPGDEREAYPNILSHETSYTTHTFFQHNSQSNLQNQNRTKSYLNLTREEDTLAGEEHRVKHKSFYQHDEPEKATHTHSLSQFNDTLADSSRTDSRSGTDSAHKATTGPGSNKLQRTKFSLAQQNIHIEKQIAREKKHHKHSKQEELLETLKLSQKQCESPDDRPRPTTSFEKKHDTPVMTRHSRPSPNSGDNLSQRLLQASHKKSTRPLEIEAIEQSNSRHESSREEEPRQTGQASLDEKIQNLNSLIEKITRDPSKGQFSELDVKLMQTLVKSLKRSKLLIKTRSRYEFVDQGDSLRCSDLVVRPQDVPGSGEGGVLSIMNLIKAFMDPSHVDSQTGDGSPDQKNKVNISF